MATYDEDYLEFYEAYPRKEGKADGAKAFRNLTKTDQRAALADVAKRVRMNAFSANKKLVQLPASYLRARRWEDDWMSTLESSRKNDDQLPSNPVTDYKPVDLGPELSTPERQLNRLWMAYNLVAMRELDVPLALQTKLDVLKDCEVLDESPAEQAQIRGELFMDRLDKAYGLKLGMKAMRQAINNRRMFS